MVNISFYYNLYPQRPQYTKYLEVLRLLESWVQLRTGRIPAIITDQDLADIVHEGVGGEKKFGSLLYNHPHLLRDYGEAKLMDVNFTGNTFQLMFTLTFPIVSIDNIQRVFSVKQTGFMRNNVCLKVDMPSSVVFIDGTPHSFDCAHSIGVLCKSKNILPVPCFDPAVSRPCSTSFDKLDHYANYVDTLSGCLVTTNLLVKAVTRLPITTVNIELHQQGVYYFNWTEYSTLQIVDEQKNIVKNISAPNNIENNQLIWIEVGENNINDKVPYLQRIGDFQLTGALRLLDNLSDTMSLVKTIKTEFKDQVSDLSFMSLWNKLEGALKAVIFFVIGFFCIAFLLIVILIFVRLLMCCVDFSRVLSSCSCHKLSGDLE